MNTITDQTTIKELQEYCRTEFVKRGFSGQSLEREFLGLVEEIGELAEVVKNLSKQNRKKGKKYDLKGELADVLLYLVTIANTHDISLADAVEKKERINRKRKWL